MPDRRHRQFLNGSIMDEPQLIEKTKRVKSSGEDAFYSYDYEELLLADSAELNTDNTKKNNTPSNFLEFLEISSSKIT